MTICRGLLTAIVLAVVSAGASSLPATPTSAAAAQWQSKSSAKVEIDGNKNPEMIPRWLIWRNAFSVVNHLERRNPRDPLPPHERMGVSKRDWDLIYAEATHQAKQEAQKRKELEPIVEKLKAQKKTIREIFEAVEPIELEERWEYLAGEDRLMALLSPEGAIALRKWIDATIVRGLRMSMDRSAFEHFRKPM